eukprot:SAG25_NODE_4131_length_883_cov_0.785714_1_plen_41_part_10
MEKPPNLEAERVAVGHHAVDVGEAGGVDHWPAGRVVRSVAL